MVGGWCSQMPGGLGRVFAHHSQPRRASGGATWPGSGLRAPLPWAIRPPVFVVGKLARPCFSPPFFRRAIGSEKAFLFVGQLARPFLALGNGLACNSLGNWPGESFLFVRRAMGQAFCFCVLLFVVRAIGPEKVSWFCFFGRLPRSFFFCLVRWEIGPALFV